MVEKILFPMKYMRVTQGVNGKYSHKGNMALDLAGKDTGIDDVFSSFTGVIRKIYNNSHTIWLESIEPVKWADGSVDYATIKIAHDNNISNIKVGQVIKQGQVFYQEGKEGNATGNHIHLEIGKGKFKGTGWFKNLFGKWCINNQVEPYKAFFITKDTIILNDGGYKWVLTDSATYDEPIALKPNDKVKISPKATNYATGEAIPSKYKNKPYTVLKIKPDRVLIKELYSWVYRKDLIK